MYFLPNSVPLPPVSFNVGTYQVVDSGVIHVPPNVNEVDMQIGANLYKFVFIDNGGDTRYDGTFTQNGLTISLFNHSHNLGQGVLGPLELLNYSDGSKLCFTYFVSVPHPGLGRRFEYCLFKQPPLGLGMGMLGYPPGATS